MYVNLIFMPTKLFRLLILFSGLFLLSSCFSYRDLEVKDFAVDNVSMQGTKIVVDFSAMVINPNRAFVIQSAEGKLNRGVQPFADVQLLQPIGVAAKSEQRCFGQMQLAFKDLFALLQMGADYTSWDMNSFLFTGDMKIKSGSVKKKFAYKEIPLKQLVNSL